jgi:hypothetical protein
VAMYESWITIGENTYPASGACMLCSVQEGSLCVEIYSFGGVSVDFFATHGGMTINGLTWPSVTSPGDLWVRHSS